MSAETLTLDSAGPGTGVSARTATLRTYRQNRRGNLTALTLSEGRAAGPDVEMTEDHNGTRI